MKIIRFWFPAVLYSGIIFYVSSIPNLKAPLSGLQFDKIYHCLEYTVFGYLIHRAIRLTSPNMVIKVSLAAVVAISFFYGLSDEWHQSFVLGRSSSLADAIADTIGGTMGALIYSKVYRLN